MLPKMGILLLSIVNTKLRDQYSNLESLCEDLDEDIDEIISILEQEGYYYNKELNQFIKK